MEHWRIFACSFGSVRISYCEHVLFFKNNNINLYLLLWKLFFKYCEIFFPKWQNMNSTSHRNKSQFTNLSMQETKLSFL